MALSAAVGSFNTGTGTTAIAVTAPGFTPAIGFFWYSDQTSSVGDTVSSGGSPKFGFGVAVSTSKRFAIACCGDDAAAKSNIGKRQEVSGCIVSCSSTSGTVDGIIDFTSWDANGFPLTPTDAFPANMRVHYLVLGGVTADCGIFTIPAGTPPFAQAVTNSGFTPTCVMMLSEVATSTASASAAGASIMIGIASGSAAAKNGVVVGTANDAAAAGVCKGYSYSGEVVATSEPAGGSTANRAVLASLDATGFTLTWTERATGRGVIWVNIAGAAASVGTMTTLTNTADAIVTTGLGFAPLAALFLSRGKAQSTQDTPDADMRLSVGAYAGTSQLSIGYYDQDTPLDMITNSALDNAGVGTTDNVYLNLTTDALQGSMKVNSLDADGFTCQMTDADPSGAQVLYLALGDAPAGGAVVPRRTLMGMGA